MDEAHRYRADTSMKSIEELKPVLGLELTATPQVESGNKVARFKNIIFDYPLANAMRDGYVKEPAVATHANFNPATMSDAALERLKLEDGIRVHESAKVDLDVYAQQNDVRKVKPFMLVIASDTDSAPSTSATTCPRSRSRPSSLHPWSRACSGSLRRCRLALPARPSPAARR
jgi:type III restriction enzyme